MYRVKVLGILWFVALILTACDSPTASTSGGSTTAPAVSSVLQSTPPAATLDQVNRGIADLYSLHPSINSFVVQAVSYTPETRDKVLKICSEGSVAVNAQERESQQVSACAPLIYFFYSYGRQNAVPEAVTLAQQLYGFAVTGKSADTQKGLVDLLRSWGIQ